MNTLAALSRRLHLERDRSLAASPRAHRLARRAAVAPAPRSTGKCSLGFPLAAKGETCARCKAAKPPREARSVVHTVTLGRWRDGCSRGDTRGAASVSSRRERCEAKAAKQQARERPAAGVTAPRGYSLLHAA